jgi:hypothetical protein
MGGGRNWLKLLTNGELWCYPNDAKSSGSATRIFVIIIIITIIISSHIYAGHSQLHTWNKSCF